MSSVNGDRPSSSSKEQSKRTVDQEEKKKDITTKSPMGKEDASTPKLHPAQSMPPMRHL